MKKIVAFLGCSLAGLICMSCESTKNIVVDNSATSLEIIQMAQTAFDKGKTKAALEYYGILLQRYGMNSAIYVEGRYEIAHIYVKHKQYNNARPMLEEILEMYDSCPPGTLPGAFKKMAQNDLEKIKEKKDKSN